MSSQSNEMEYNVSTSMPLVPGLDSLGYGYDIFGRYANTLNATKKLFNLGELVTQSIDDKDYHIPECVNFRFVNENSFDSFSGETLSEYVTSLSSVVGVDGEYNCFSASLEIDFDANYLRNSNYAFTKIINVIQKWILALPDESVLKSKLNPLVQKELDSLPYNQLFDKYGSHYLAEIIVGAKATYNSSVNKELFKSAFSIGTSAEMSYKSLVKSISVSEETTYGESITNYEKNSHSMLHTLGGKPEFASGIMNGYYNDWIDSVSKNPQFCDFTPRGLRPIWNLCTDDKRKTELEAAFHIYAKSKQKNLGTICINDLEVIFSSSSEIPAPFGFKKLEYDINAGHKHDYLFICYKTGLDNDVDAKNLPVTDIKVVVSDNALTKATDDKYKLIPHDLNTGFGNKSKFIYIEYTKDPALGKPIRGIKLIHGDKINITAPYGYIKNPNDLKQNTGGQYVFLCTSTEFNN